MKTLTLLAALLFITQANAQEEAKPKRNIEYNELVDANDIYKTCKHYFKNTFNTKENFARKATCHAYFYGIGATLLTLKKNNIETGFCIKDDLTTDELMHLYVDWAKEHPDHMDMPAMDAIFMAIDSEFYCEQ